MGIAKLGHSEGESDSRAFGQLQQMAKDLPPPPPPEPPPAPKWELPTHHNITKDEWELLEGLRRNRISVGPPDKDLVRRHDEAAPRPGGKWMIQIYPHAIGWSKTTSKEDRQMLMQEEKALLSAFRKQVRALGLREAETFKGRFLVADSKWPAVKKALRNLMVEVRAFNAKAKSLGSERKWVLSKINVENLHKSTTTLMREEVAQYLGER